MPEPMRIIQLVSVLLSMRYNKMTSCTKTFVMICMVKKLWYAQRAPESMKTYRSALVRSMDGWENHVRKHIPDGHPSKLIPFSPMRDI